MRKVEVRFGEQTYTITELPSRQNTEWRKGIQTILGELRGMLDVDPNTNLSLDFVAGILSKVQEYVMGSVELLTNMLFSYSPELSADREAILATCYDSEIVDAFLQVLKLAFPFFGALPVELGRGKK